jgi:hypothetical protein
VLGVASLLTVGANLSGHKYAGANIDAGLFARMSLGNVHARALFSTTHQVLFRALSPLVSTYDRAMSITVEVDV